MSRYTHCNLDALLKLNGISRADFEQEAGLHQAHCSRIISGHTKPTVAIVLRIMDALETLTGNAVDVRDVWTLADKPRYRRPASLAHGYRRAA